MEDKSEKEEVKVSMESSNKRKSEDNSQLKPTIKGGSKSLIHL